MKDYDDWVAHLRRTGQAAPPREDPRIAALEAEVERLRAALVEERARYLAADTTPYLVTEQARAWARDELIAEGLLPPA